MGKLLRMNDQVIDLLKMRKQIAAMLRPHLFEKVRLTTAIWHTLAISKNPLSPEEIFEAMLHGDVSTTADDFTIKNVKRALDYHTKVGKLKYVGHEHWTIA